MRSPVLAAFAMVMLVSATAEYWAEHLEQPDRFGSLPAALWWCITTLTTTGYGDAVPATPLGRIVGGAVMVCGIALFALWAGILASGFASELRRRDFLRTWNLVAQVPLFRDLGAAVIAEVARLLRPRAVAAGSVLMRLGEPGDCMYFIVSGAVEVRLPHEAVRLDEGAFFGELALITGAPRTAAAVALQPTQLLVLDIADFREVSAHHPSLAAAIAQEAARRSAKRALAEDAMAG
ncbi:MAG: cyclic nucleotide-gated ion channel [Alphaproteobacteria bacterium]